MKRYIFDKYYANIIFLLIHLLTIMRLVGFQSTKSNKSYNYLTGLTLRTTRLEPLCFLLKVLILCKSGWLFRFIRPELSPGTLFSYQINFLLFDPLGKCLALLASRWMLQSFLCSTYSMWEQQLLLPSFRGQYSLSCLDSPTRTFYSLFFLKRASRKPSLWPLAMAPEVCQRKSLRLLKFTASK